MNCPTVTHKQNQNRLQLCTVSNGFEKFAARLMLLIVSHQKFNLHLGDETCLEVVWYRLIEFPLPASECNYPRFEYSCPSKVLGSTSKGRTNLSLTEARALLFTFATDIVVASIRGQSNSSFHPFLLMWFFSAVIIPKAPKTKWCGINRVTLA